MSTLIMINVSFGLSNEPFNKKKPFNLLYLETEILKSVLVFKGENNDYLYIVL